MVLARLVLILALVAAACSGVTDNGVGEQSPTVAAPERATTQPADPTAIPTSAPTATPEPTPTPTPTLIAEPVANSGLFRLSLESGAIAQPVGISVDGQVRAVVRITDTSQDVSVWVPPGERLVCVGPVDADAVPAYWSGPNIADPSGAAEPPTETSTPVQIDDGICASVTGNIVAPERLYPDNRVVAYYGVGITPFLGVLGEGTPEEATQSVVAAAAAFAELDPRPTLPAFEFIATVAQADPGADGSYSFARPKDEIRTYLEAIRTVGGIMVLDFQPGRADFLDQIRQYEDLLREPDVHLALDPEWSMRADGVPGRVIGSTDAETVNEILDYVQGLVIRHGLPQKMVLVHQFRSDMIKNRADIVDPEGVAVLFHVDGQGPVESKYATYNALSVDPPFFNGFKLFFDEDSRVLTPEEVLAMEPAPLFVSYQ